MKINEYLAPLIGEFAWHSLIEDPRIQNESERHYGLINNIIDKFSLYKGKDLHILEIGSYAHITGYQLADRMNAQVTLFELSRNALRTGKRISGSAEDRTNPLCVSGDFHHLPFEDGSFNFVFICSALHHTWRYETVLREMLRVLCPDGILFLENEPTARELCFHKFRSNRAHEFTDFEKKLNKLGIIKTVAEPFLGSRPEHLFGMIENQTMALDSILGEINAHCDVIEIGLFPEHCIGDLEKLWLSNCHIGQKLLQTKIIDDLNNLFKKADSALTEKEKGMGFSLPNDTELHDKAYLVSSALAQLPVDKDSLDYRIKLSQIFGAALQLTARKRKEPGRDLSYLTRLMQEKRSRFVENTCSTEGIYNSFPQGVHEALGQSSIMPDIQKSSIKDIRQSFPAKDWTTSLGDYELIAMEDLEHNFLSLVNKKNTASLAIAVHDKESDLFLFILRIFAQVTENKFYKINICCGEDIIFEQSMFQSENILCKTVIKAEMLTSANGKIVIRLDSLTENPSPTTSRIAVSYAGMFRVNP